MNKCSALYAGSTVRLSIKIMDSIIILSKNIICGIIFIIMLIYSLKMRLSIMEISLILCKKSLILILDGFL